jgi:hypothetical protein
MITTRAKVTALVLVLGLGVIAAAIILAATSRADST